LNYSRFNGKSAVAKNSEKHPKSDEQFCLDEQAPELTVVNFFRRCEAHRNNQHRFFQEREMPKDKSREKKSHKLSAYQAEHSFLHTVFLSAQDHSHHSAKNGVADKNAGRL
jgi:hypothetical protein